MTDGLLLTQEKYAIMQAHGHSHGHFRETLYPCQPETSLARMMLLSTKVSLVPSNTFHLLNQISHSP
jgi:hypothetical protein